MSVQVCAGVCKGVCCVLVSVQVCVGVCIGVLVSVQVWAGVCTGVCWCLYRLYSCPVESETTKHHEGLVMRAADLEQQYTQVSKEREQFLAENAALKVRTLSVFITACPTLCVLMCLVHNQKALGELKRALTATREVADKQQRALQALEMSMKKQESEFLEEKANDKRQLRESEGRSDGLAREADMLKKTVKTMKGQLVQLQELLASREHQHKYY